MFCPKCGARNEDTTKFCRGCGADLSNVLAVVEGRAADLPELSEKHIELFSSGLRGLITGAGFMAVAIVALALSPRLGVAVLFSLAFAFFFLGTGISRLVQSRAIKRLRQRKVSNQSHELEAGSEAEYIKPSRSIYETDDLVKVPSSVTEHTTTHLKRNPDGDPSR